MSTQPNNILLSFTNVDTLSTDEGRSNDTHYYYKDGEVYIDGQENIPEFKALNLSNEQLSKTTRLMSSLDTIQAIQAARQNVVTYNSPYDDGISINFKAHDEIFLVHNYTGNTNIGDKSKISPDSWWYDTSLHKMYRVYLRVSWEDSEARQGGTVRNYIVKEVRKVYRTHDEDDKSGIYSFVTPPPEDIGITGSVKIKTNGGGNVWETVKLNLYYNGSVIGSTTVDTTTTTLPTTMNVLIDRTKDSIKSNDELKMSVQVSDAPTLHNDALLVTEYSMSISSETNVDAPETILGFSNNLGLAKDFDCQPTLNNTIVARQSEFVQDVDYSISSEGSGSLTPQNLSQIRNNQAEKAAVPDSNYTQYSSVIPRYYGSKTNREGVNNPIAVPFNSNLVDNSGNNDLKLSPFYFTTDNLGSLPNVESKNTYLGYFEKVIDPYPILNNKTAYYVKYLVDKNTDIQDPSLSIQGENNLKNTFKLNDVNSLPTSVKASVQNIDENNVLQDLEELATVFKVGSYPTPILYSQNSSNTFSDSIVLSGSSTYFNNAFDGSDENYRNLAYIAEGTYSGIPQPSKSGTTITLEGSDGTRLIPRDVNYIFEKNNVKAYSNDTGITSYSESLTDEYYLNVNYNFYTTHLPPQLYYNSLNKFNWGSFNIGVKSINGTYLSPEDVDVRLIQWSNSKKIGEGNAEEVPLLFNRSYSFEKEPSPSVPLIQRVTGNFGENGGVRINFDSHQIYTALSSSPIFLSSTNTTLVNNLWNDQNSTEKNNFVKSLSYDEGNYLEWKVSFKVKLPSYSTSEVRLEVTRDGSISPTLSPPLQSFTPDARVDRFFATTKDVNASISPFNLRRSFNPFGVENSNVNNIQFRLIGRNTPTEDELGKANAPYWDFENPTTIRNKIYLKNELLNNNHKSNYYQDDLEYTPGPNTNFPFSREPSFTTMPAVTNQWEVKKGDEFRFENLEDKSFIVTNVYKKFINGKDRLEVTFNKDIPEGTTLDFFLIRRYKPSNNFVILNQQKPYGFPPSASSSPGILQTQYQSEELETNPDKVITNLIERDLI